MSHTKTKKVKHHHKHTEDDCVTYVKLDGSLPLRKDILEGAIESAELLKAWENYHKFKSDKMAVYKVLSSLLDKVDKEVVALKRHIPRMSEIDLPEIKEKKVVEKPKMVEEQKPKQLEKEFKSKLDKEIYDIHEKLRKLGV